MTHTMKALRAQFRAVGKYHTPPELARKTHTATLPELIAEVERLQAQIQAAQQLLTDLKKASDHQYSRALVILRLKQALGENQ